MNRDYALDLKIISDGVDKWLSACAKEYGVTPTQGRVMVFLHENRDRKITQRDIEKHLGCCHATVSGIIMRMKLKGLIKVSADKNDGRAKNIVINEKCLTVLDGTMKNEINKMDDYILKGFSDEEKKLFASFIERASDNIQRNKFFPKENEK